MLRNHSESEVAEFFLCPGFCPEKVMRLLIDQKRLERARVRAEQEESRPKHSSRRLICLATALALSGVIALVSCAVTAGGPDLAGQNGWNKIKSRIRLAFGKDFETWQSASDRLQESNSAGLLLLDSNGSLSPFMPGSDHEKYLAHLERWQYLPDENEFLRKRLNELQGAVDSGKPYLEIDLDKNSLIIKMDTKSLYRFPIVSGKGSTYLSSLRRYRSFRTPRGVFKVQNKRKDPVWYKPNWVWHEKGLSPPKGLSYKQRAVHGVLGKYKISLGDGYAIHGTRSGRITPGKRSHGCIRMNANDLKKVYEMVNIGTPVFIY